MKKYYVDACCRIQDNTGSYAIVSGKEYYTGHIPNNVKLNSGYCELYGIREALYKTRNEEAIIYNDNSCVNNLNLPLERFEKKFRKKKLKDHGLLREVYDLYRIMPNVSIRWVNRRKVRCADMLARKTLKKVNPNGGC